MRRNNPAMGLAQQENDTMKNFMSYADRLSGLTSRLHFRTSERSRRRQLERRFQVVAEVLRLEEQSLLNEVVPISREQSEGRFVHDLLERRGDPPRHNNGHLQYSFAGGVRRGRRPSRSQIMGPIPSIRFSEVRMIDKIPMIRKIGTTTPKIYTWVSSANTWATPKTMGRNSWASPRASPSRSRCRSSSGMETTSAS